MTKTSKTVVFFGNERLATGVSTNTPTLRGLIEAGHRVAAVVVAQNQLDKSRQARELEVASVAKQHGIPLLSPDKPVQIKQTLSDLKADVGVLVAYGNLVPDEIIELFPAGIVNIHPSLLPKHRGSIPIESVILEAAAETGVSLMKLVQAMDAGPVYDQRRLPLTGQETKQELSDQLSLLGSQMVVEHLDGIVEGSLQPSAQDEGQASYDSRLDKSNGVLDWSKPAARLEREVRAYLGWPRSRTEFGGISVIVTQAQVGTETGPQGQISVINKRLGVFCGEGQLLIERLIPAGKPEMSAEAFLAGYSLDLS